MNKIKLLKDEIRSQMENDEKLSKEKIDKMKDYLMLNLKYHYCMGNVKDLNKDLCSEYIKYIPEKTLEIFRNYKTIQITFKNN